MIPFTDVGTGFNPGELLEYYLSMLPLEAHKKDQKKYLFPKPRHASKNFNLHNLNERLFETNMKSKLTVAKYKLLEMFFFISNPVGA